MYVSYLSAQSMLIDITLFVGGFCVENSVASSSDREKYLLQVEGENNTMESGVRYTYLGHDHNLVAWKVKLFDSLSENNFRFPIRIGLAIQLRK